MGGYANEVTLGKPQITTGWGPLARETNQVIRETFSPALLNWGREMGWD